jgi:hypothetical protein
MNDSELYAAAKAAITEWKDESENLIGLIQAMGRLQQVVESLDGKTKTPESFSGLQNSLFVDVDQGAVHRS